MVLAFLIAATSLVLATGTAQPAGADLSEATALCVESVGAISHVQDTVFGPDGNLWWVEASPPAVGRLNVATGRVSRFSAGLLLDRDLLKSITVGPDGNLWITSNQFNRVGRVTTAGVITMFSDGITPGTPPVGSVPHDITAGPDGNVWFTELNNKAIGRITPNGTITEFPYTGDFPGGANQITLGADDHLWFTTPGFIGRMSPTTGVVQKFITGVERLFDRGSPFAITAAPDGSVWFTRAPAEAGGVTVSRLTPQGQVTDYPVPAVGADFPQIEGAAGFLTDIVLGPDGALWVTDLIGGRILRVSTGGQVTEHSEGLRLEAAGHLWGVGPAGITVGPDGALWYAEFFNNGFTGVPGGIGRITTGGVVSSFGNASAERSRPDGPPHPMPFFDVTAGPDGNMWFANGFGLVRVTPDGRTRQFVDGFTSATLVPGGQYAGLTGAVAAGPDGNLWFTQSRVAGSPAVGRMTPAGVVTEFTAGLSSGSQPGYIAAGPDGNLWFIDAGTDSIGRVTPAGGITLFSAGITSTPTDITVGPDGAMWFTERAANRIGRITSTGVVTEFVLGPPGAGAPQGITTGPDGNLWFTEEFTEDNFYGRIGRMTPTGAITLFDEGIQTHQLLPTAPWDIVAADGVLWFTSRTTNQVGRITTDGVITMFSAKGPNLGSLDFQPYPDYPLGFPFAIAADPNGDLWWTDLLGGLAKFGHATERDDFGDPCNPDDDADGVRDVIDNCPFVVNANQRDWDNDGIGDLCDRSVTVDVSGHRLGSTTSARLLDSSGAPIAGATLVFTPRFLNRTCTAVTDSTGRATCRFDRTSVMDYSARFAGDALHDPGTGQTWPTSRR